MNNRNDSSFWVQCLFVLAPLLAGMAVDLYVPSLPTITRYFEVAKYLTQWTVSSYLIGYGIGLLILGALSDSIGRKLVILPSAVIFSLTSLLVVISPNIESIIIIRFLQGIAMAGLVVPTRAMINDSFSGKQLTKAVILTTMSWALGPMVGPFLGAYLQGIWSWKADFYFFAMYGAALILFIVTTIPETIRYRHPLNVKQLKLNILTIFNSKAFVFSAIGASLVYGVLVTFNICGPFLIQKELHYSPIVYGYAALFIGIGTFMGNTVSRILSNRFSSISMIGVSTAVSFLLSIVMVAVVELYKVDLYAVIVPMLLIAFMLGIVFPSLAVKSLSLFPTLGGNANAVWGAFLSFGAFLVSLVVSTLHIHTTHSFALTMMIEARSQQ